MFQKKKIFIWLAVLIALFVLNLFVEAVILPALGLVNTPKNDGYFITWWLVTGVWFLFGLIAIDHFSEKRKSTA